MRLPVFGTPVPSSSRVQFAGKKQLTQEEIDRYRKTTGITDPIAPENTSKTESDAVYGAKYASVVGIWSAVSNRLKGNNTFNALQDKIEASQTPILGLDKMTFVSAEQAQNHADKENAKTSGFPQRVAFHAPGSKKVLTFMTNDADKAAAIREKLENCPFTDYEENSSAFSSTPNLILPDETASGVTGENPLASADDDENPFKDPATRRGSWAHEAKDYWFEHPQNQQWYKARDKRNADGSRVAHDTTHWIAMGESQRKPDSSHKDE